MITNDQIRIKLCAAIRESDMKQKKIAQQIGITQQSLGQYLTGRSMPSVETLANLCNVLDVSADYILGLTDIDGVRITDPTSQTVQQSDMYEIKTKKKASTIKIPAAARSERNQMHNVTLELTEDQLQALIKSIKGE